VRPVYVETSSLLSWLLGEPTGRRVLTELNDADVVATSVLTLLESERALVRGESRELFTAAQGRQLRGILRRAAAGWVGMEMTEEVRERAGRPFPVEPVRTLDAIHLSTALMLGTAFPELKMLTLDERVAQNAEALGLA
jgi:predicted nucleic acid-binding protein